MEKIQKNKLLEFRYHLTSKWLNWKQQWYMIQWKWYLLIKQQNLSISVENYSFFINLNNSRAKFSQTRSWSVFLFFFLQSLLNVVKTVSLLYEVVQHLLRVDRTQRKSCLSTFSTLKMFSIVTTVQIFFYLVAKVII